MSAQAAVLKWIHDVTMFGLQQGDTQEKVIPLLPDTFGCDEALKLDDLCDAKLLCALAISSSPSLAQGPVGMTVPARITFFATFCQKLGVPAAKIVKPEHIWPKPAKNPGLLTACLGEVATLLAASESKAPKLDPDVAAEAAGTAATTEEAAKKAAEDARLAEFKAQIDAMAPAAKGETATEEVRKAKAGEEEDLPSNDVPPSTSFVLTAKDDDATVELAVVPTHGEEGEGGDGEAVESQEAMETTKYEPPSDSVGSTFKADALPTMKGYLHKQTGSSMFRFTKYDRRYFILRDMHIHWWKTEDEANAPAASAPDGGPNCKGTISLLADPAEIELESGSPTKFSLRPKSGHWGGKTSAGSKAKDSTKVYAFDTAETEHTREEWVEAIYVHVAKAEQLKSPELQSLRGWLGED